MKQTGWKRLGAAMLTLAMLLSVVPSVGFAADTSALTAEVASTSGDVENNDLDSHTFGAWKITKPATETETGIKTRTCTVCGYAEEECLPVLTHTHRLVKVEGIAATCTEDGYKDYYRCDCDKFFEDASGKQEIADPEQWKSQGGKLPATDHTFDEWKVTKPATETETGIKTRACTVCGYAEEEVISKKPITGWQRNHCGWWYNDDNGKYVTGWQKIDGAWYYFAGNGYMQTDWQVVNGYWYYFAPSGAMQTGWQMVDGSWYYFAPGGDMLTGWQKVNDYWYYFSPSGDMQTDWQVVNGYWYYFSPSGDMQTGWQKVDGSWYYFAPGGDMLTGWQKVNDYWYYFAPSGAMQTGWQVVNGYWYYFSPSGDMQTGWQKVDGSWYYFAPGGDMLTGWQRVNGYWYYFAPSGYMMTGWQWIDGCCYYFEPSGCMGSKSLVWPCDSYDISSPFGYRNRPTSGASSFHNGIDIADWAGAAIYAAASGEVLCTGYNSFRGYYIEISHGNGLKTVYMHCKALYVNDGDQVSAGQHIAAMGSTGIATGPHLHFGVMVNGCYQDPESLWAD